MAGADDLVIGIDASTTAVKALIVDRQGVTVAEGRATILLENPATDAWEQDAETWWSALGDAVRKAQSGLPEADRSRVKAMSIACQRETFVLCDAEGVPLAKAWVWMDARARNEVGEATRELASERIHSISGKPPCVTPSLYKIRYLLERARPDLKGLPFTVFDVHGFLVRRLTGLRVTSLASADPLGLVDLACAAWSPELLALSHVSPTQVPDLMAAGSTMGRIVDHVADALHLPRGVALVAGAGDGQAACLGAGVIARASAETPLTAYMNLGTALVVGVPSRELCIDRAFRTLYGCVPDTYLLETDLKGGTFTLDWLADRILGGAKGFSANEARTRALAELEQQAAELPPGADGLVTVPYWLGVMNPVWDDDASGILLGLRGDHGPSHLYRSIIEGLAFETKHHLEGVARVTGPIDGIVIMGGGSRSNLVTSIFADVLDIPLFRAGSSEATALGAAMMAGASIGWHGSIEGASIAMNARGARIPTSPHRERYERIYRDVYTGLFDAVQSRMHKLTELTRS